MTRCSRAATFAALSILWCSASASAETMRCRSVNGNLNCAGSGGVSCQTVNGQKTCVSGHGDVVQSFGKSTASDLSADGADAEGLDDVPPAPVIKDRLEQHDRRGHTLLMDRDGAKLHLRTDRLSVDRD
jgi:hypothetical protein